MITINDMKHKHFSKDDFVFFWGHTDHQASDIGKQCLSQWYHSPFVIGDVCYNCSEQYMMAEKAYAFGDEHIWHEIMAAYDSLTIKKLGQRADDLGGFTLEEQISERYVNHKPYNVNENFLISPCTKIQNIHLKQEAAHR